MNSTQKSLCRILDLTYLKISSHERSKWLQTWKPRKGKFSHKADYIEALNTNLDLKEGEGRLATHGDGRNGGFARWNGHEGSVKMEEDEEDEDGVERVC